MVRNGRPRKVPGQDQLPRIAQAASFCKHGRVLVSALRAAASMKLRQCHSEETPQARTDRYGDLLPSLAVARLGTRRLCGMMDPMWASFSPDGTKLASQ